ncbi:hydantoinase/oxoprolinase N-terminal domain-containing protein [Streptomyces radicis]|uniref:Hydantoinase/oxoprolinase family protein n=1 Tax=Streptomyces radicis TaxID=1750517 RepID=A0A3A9VU14_9ACTN|nr:hydantoinase/oxoprolinase family protein [Streptomyces radicis]RKN04230.1 hydantoinase/oxoprolinase family protein [Streptomyces radicis]RKN14748.1 hydantoinase/oxoprolinase family protein [Streptomyces radicis]
MHIGIDVGGTNTDAVLMSGETMLASVKRPTSANVTDGIVAALAGLAEAGPLDASAVAAVMIGTTQFTNAVVERRQLSRTGVVRLGLPAGTGVPPMSDWPRDLAATVGHHVHQAHGGNEFDGRVLSPLRPDELRAIGERLAADGVDAVAISSIFSPVSQDAELTAESLLREALPEARYSLSHRIGRLGLLERENATILNAALLGFAETVTEAFTAALTSSGIDAPLYLSQNDGTLMDVMYARSYPVSTFASGPTNSMRGAALLTGLADCVVIDVGGTTSDIGMLAGGFPRQAGSEVDIGGVRSNFRMPDVVSVGIGGGSRIRSEGGVTVGPDSVGHALRERALVFGGDTLTATDVAVAAGLAAVGDPALVRGLDRHLVRHALERITHRIAETADLMRVTPDPLPAVLVGGGSVLLGDRLPGFDSVVRPGDAGVANAIGASIAQAGGEVDRIYPLGTGDRAKATEAARTEAVERAVAAGADPATVEVVDIDELPISYLPGNSVRIRAKAVGNLLLGETR